MKNSRRLGIVIPEGAKVLMTRIPGEPAPGVVKARSKYGAVPTTYKGVRYASRAEAARAEFLDSCAPIGVRWIGQPRFRLGCPENVYVADFLVWDGVRVHVEDVKGVRTAKFARDVKLWRAYGPADLWVVAGEEIEFIPGGGA